MTRPATASAPDTSEPGFYLSPEEIDYRRGKMAEDVWLFIKFVCRHGERAVERFHRPLAYYFAGDAPRLAACLETYESEVTRQIRYELKRRNIDWTTSKGIAQLKQLLRFINNRIARSHGKTTISLDVLLWLATHNPDIDIGIASKSDPAAWGMCEAIGNIMRSDEYALYYHDRLYPLANGKGYNYDSYITQEWIKMRGRRKAFQETIEARGINSQWYSRHYDIIYCDDLSSTEAKQGVATLQDAKRFMASMSGLSIANEWGGTREMFNGTIAGPRDDNAILASNDDYLSLRIPIWIKSSPATIKNLLADGDPVLPEWNRIEDIRRMRKKEIENPEFGPISWLQNFELTAHEEGSMNFTADMLRASKFMWVNRRVRTADNKEIVQRWIRRYLWDVDKDGNRIPKLSDEMELLPLNDACRCYQQCRHRNHAYVEHNPMNLPRILGVDQAFALHGDKWSVGVVARDPQNFLYSLKGRSARGYDAMIAAIPLVFNQYGGSRNPPRKVGIESNAAQSVTATWMQRSEDAFGVLSHRVVKVSPGQIQKTLRIFNNVYAGMEMGTLLTDPDDTEFDKEAVSYDPNASKPEDNILDSIAIGVVLHTQPTTDPDEDCKQQLADDKAYWSHVDPQTGVDTSLDFFDAIDGGELFN